MRYHEIVSEAPTLALRRGQLPALTYFPFVVTMAPLDYIRLTCNGDECVEAILANSKTRIKPNDEYETTYADDIAGRFHAPSLGVTYPTGEIFAHEGRHRAASVHLSGGKVIPVVVKLRDEVKQVVTYQRHDWETDEESDHTEEFDDFEAADARVKDLKRFDHEDASYARIKHDYKGGKTLRGNPERTGEEHGWNGAPWRIEDFPDQLVGQFDQSVVVPKARFRVGRNPYSNVERK